MKKLKKLPIILLSALTLSGSMIEEVSSAEDNKEALEQRLQTLRQENRDAEIASLKEQIAVEESKKAEREGGGASTSQPQSQPVPDQPTATPEANEKSTWVRERNRIEDQAQDKFNKLKDLF